MRAVRNVLSLLLLSAALAAGLLGGLGQWVDTMARTSGPAADVVAPLAADPVVLGAISAELDSAARERIPSAAERIPGLRSHIEQLLTRAVDAALADDGVDAAWRESIERTRAGAVADLDAYRLDPSETPTLWLDLTPFVELGREKLMEAADSRVEPYLEQIAWSETVQVPLGRPDAASAKLAGEALGMAQNWMFAYVAAAVIAAIGLVAGSRRGRWLALTLAALLGLGAVLAGRFVAGQIDLAASSAGLQSVVIGRLGQGARDSLLSWTEMWPLLLLAVAGLGIVALVVTSVRSRARVAGGE